MLHAFDCFKFAKPVIFFHCDEMYYSLPNPRCSIVCVHAMKKSFYYFYYDPFSWYWFYRKSMV